jgi:tetratricopeptide (TPR) repeat protein
MSSHPKPDEIQRFLESQTARENRGIARHLLECTTCRARALRALRTDGSSDGIPSRQPPLLPRLAKILAHPRSSPAGVSSTAAAWIAWLYPALQELRHGEEIAAELRRHPVDRWRLLLGNRTRFQILPVVQVILDQSRLTCFDEPPLAADLARLALELLDRLEVTRYGARLLDDLRGRSWTYLGGALRCSCELDGAEKAFDRASGLLADTPDAVELGTYSHQLSALRIDQRRFEEAGGLLRRAYELFDGVGDDLRAVRALTALGCLYVEQGSPAEALPPLLEAQECVDAAEDPRTSLAIRHNLALSLTELGEHAEARRLFVASREDYRKSDTFLRVRGCWLEGLIALGFGEEESAERLLREVKTAFDRDRMPYDSALVSLDLAMVLAAQGRHAELRELAEEMTATFTSLDVHREAMAAVGFLRRAVEQEQATAEMVAAIARFLKRSRHRPELRFTAAG